jgi:2'-5' RNA ligase
MSLIVTLALDPESFAWLDGLRRRHFPPERNFLPAHLTLFHHLPEDPAAGVADALADAAGTGAPRLEFAGWRSLGRGVAQDVRSEALVALRARLAAAFAPFLTRQDAQGFRPHVTVQNKVEPAVARALLAELAATFVPRTGAGVGLTLWRYLDGPWAEVREFPFRGAAAGSAR